MATERLLRRGTAAEMASFTGVQNEISYETDTGRLVFHDGVTAGGAFKVPTITDLQSNGVLAGLAGGTGNAITLTLSPALVAYSDRMVVWVEIASNNTGATTINVNGLGNKDIQKFSGGSLTALTGSELLAGMVVPLIYDGTQFQLGVTGLTTDSVTQAIIAASAVGQAELKTATGNVSVMSSTLANLTLPGGEYGFYPRVWRTGSGSVSARIVEVFNDNMATTFIALLNDPGTGTSFASQRYIQASPPYDLGDGEIDGSFIFAAVDAGGNIVMAYQAADPPWANNGPTSIRPTRTDPITGRQYRRVLGLTSEVLRANPAQRAALLAGEANPAVTEIEITQAVKQADMPLIPHPFIGNDLTGLTVVLADPMSPAMRLLHDMQQSGEDVLSLFAEGTFRFDNTELGRARPPGVMSVGLVT